ncbi:hypothetical protein JIQ42_00682 [Leishmania sp. Namibia]|uniref:hypothetical protein n=1 Tax=Leishmania sp. Namibia TaxID=2802991 RepID=UPI001B52B183|nr:hypothetical protein JIQ42_00682 [Leishmania sp. Namibia]
MSDIRKKSQSQGQLRLEKSSSPPRRTGTTSRVVHNDSIAENETLPRTPPPPSFLRGNDVQLLETASLAHCLPASPAPFDDLSPHAGRHPDHRIANPINPASTEDDATYSIASPSQDQPQKISFFSSSNISAILAQAIGGSLSGYSIGFVGVYSTLFGYSTNCASFLQEKSCTTVPNADCKWFVSPTGTGYCGWPEITCRKEYAYTNPAEMPGALARCEADSRCRWSYSDEECQNPSGYSSSESGIFAGSMIAGCLIGSVFAGPLASKIGARLSFLLVGLVGVVSSVMYHASCAADEFWVLIVGRFVIGLFLGVICVACPVYTDQNAHPKWKRTIGVMFQVFTTLGIFVAALMGLALGQSIRFDHDGDQRVMARMQGLCVFSTLFSLLTVVLGIVTKESRAKFGGDEEGGDEEGCAELNPNEYGYIEMIPRLLMGCVMAGTLQLTGINAVMNYAPTIMGSLGLAPLVGNFVVMLWNFVTTLASIPLSYVFTMRQLFLFGSIFTSCMCLFMCGIPVYPGVSKKLEAKNGVAITGILLFILGFEYAPTIMGSLGLAPLVGNFVVMLWNFVTTLASIPLSYVFTMRQLFLFGSIFMSCMCLFMCGIPVYPGVSKKLEVKNGVAITGILLFILGFEVCVGPCYYVLTQDMFPPSFRPRGASFTQVAQFIFNLIINVCYPIATESISGGPSGNQDKGQAVAFIFFGCLGFICFVIQVFFLHPWDEERDGKKVAAPAIGKKELSEETIGN